MTLTKRISELLQVLYTGVPEREACIQLGFLAAINGEPFYIFGRSGSGKSVLTDRLSSAFKNPKILKMGVRQQSFPNNLTAFDIVIFQNFNPLDETSKENIKTALKDRETAPLMITSDQRPETILSRAEIMDRITLTIALPESLTPKGLCNLLQNQSKLDDVRVPLGLAVGPEEQRVWQNEIKKVNLSADTLAIVAELADLCDKSGIYVSIRRWMALTNIIKAIAFFNRRTETKFTDALFLGTPIWSKSASNAVITENFNGIVRNQILKEIPDVQDKPYDAEGLFKKVNQLLRSSNNLYETKVFNNEPCLSFRVTIAGESIPLYVPLRYVETDEDFNPFNEFRKVETRVRCNFRGTSSCSIAIDSAVKGVGLRSSFNNTSSGKFEDYANLPSYILKENDPEIAKQKKVQLEECRKEANAQLEIQTKYLLTLRDLYLKNKQAREDLFCNLELFDKIQGEIRAIFDNTTAIANKLKETVDMFNKMGASTPAAATAASTAPATPAAAATAPANPAAPQA